MQVFRLHSGSAVPLIKQLVPLLRNLVPRDITKKYKDGNRQHTLVERRKKAHRSTENFKAEGIIVQHYFGHMLVKPEVPSAEDYNEESLCALLFCLKPLVWLWVTVLGRCGHNWR
jgi:hypothetical protein